MSRPFTFLHHGRDLRVNLSERLHEVVLRREHRGLGDQDYHDLPVAWAVRTRTWRRKPYPVSSIELTFQFEGWKKFDGSFR